MKFYIYTLGCKVNTYESNVIVDLMTNAGYKQVMKQGEADIFIVNSCTVTNMANSKSLKLIRQGGRYNPRAPIIVCGCLTQHNYKPVLDIEGVAVIIGNKNKSKIVQYLNKYLEDKKQIIDLYDLTSTEFETMKLNNFDKTRAFIKIEDGCNNFCSYCVIPYVRGNCRSKKKEDVLEEVSNLVRTGHQEIVLTGIHTGNYGSEFDNYNLASLLKDMLKIEGLLRIRISSIEATEITDEILSFMKDNPILVSHMHIPLQSGSDSVLKRMNRKYDKEYFINKIKEIRSVRPDISITTDVIVGFPGETDEEFEETIDTIKRINFSKLHVFPYSLREGTKAADIPNHVKEDIKKSRSKVLLSLSKDLEQDYMDKFIGEKLEFIPETYKDGYLYGHTGNYLAIKAGGCKELLHQNILVEIKKSVYPHLLSNIID